MAISSNVEKMAFVSRQRILWLILILTPLIAVTILSLATHTGLLRLDAYHTTWNDELGYLRAVRIIRSQGISTGVAGYNEVASAIPAYGAYSILVYLPYVAASFLTGISSHNFMYFCNVLMIAIANLIFVFLVRPDEKKTVWLILFSSFSLVYERYVWSGMSEASHCAFAIVMLACLLWLFQEREKPLWKERTVLWFAIGISLYFGMLRPFHYVWLLVPIVYIAWKQKKKTRWVEILCVVVGVFLCYRLYLFLAANWSVEFFSDSSTTDMLTSYLQMLRHGQVGGAIRGVLHSNNEALRVVYERLRGLKWAGIVVTTFCLNEIILLIQTVRSWISKNKNQAVLTGLCFLIGILIYEANIVLYSVNQSHRMLLCVVVFSAYLICMGESWPLGKGVRQGVETAMILAALCINTDSFALPQVNEAVDVAELTNSLADVLVFDEEDAWGNTIAKNVESHNLYVSFCLPTYINTNTCQDSYLESAIQSDEIKSKYIMLTDGHALNALCEEKYEIVWQGEGHTIYLNSQK